MKNHINDLIDLPLTMRTSWQKTLIVNLNPYTQSASYSTCNTKHPWSSGYDVSLTR